MYMSEIALLNMDAHVTVNTVRRYYYATVAGDTSGKALEYAAWFAQDVGFASAMLPILIAEG